MRELLVFGGFIGAAALAGWLNVWFNNIKGSGAF